MLVFSRRSLSLLPLAAGLFFASLLTGGCRDVVGLQDTAWEGELQPLGPAQLHGSVAVVSGRGRAQTSIQILDAEPDATYAWQIRSGSCQDAGDVMGGSAVYPVLVPDPTGTAESGAVLSSELDPEGSFAAWVFPISDTDDEPSACGAIVRLR
jgi:hypothetical protein